MHSAHVSGRRVLDEESGVDTSQFCLTTLIRASHCSFCAISRLLFSPSAIHTLQSCRLSGVTFYPHSYNHWLNKHANLSNHTSRNTFLECCWRGTYSSHNSSFFSPTTQRQSLANMFILPHFSLGFPILYLFFYGVRCPLHRTCVEVTR